MNLDKYEGHTPGPWVALHMYWPVSPYHGGGLREEDSDEAGNYAESHIYTEAYAYAENGETYGIPTTDWGSICGGVSIEDMATANLVAAAPDLLAEVKRLRGLLLEIWKHANECSEEPAEMDETLSAIARALMKEDMR